MIQTMILNDTVMNDYERVKKWRKKNRARYNLYQRNRRKDLKVNLVQVAEPSDGASAAQAIPEGRTTGSSPVTGAISTLEYLKGLEMAEREKTRVEAPVIARVVRRSETGMILTEEQWEVREEYKRKSREKGFEPDEYAQA